MRGTGTKTAWKLQQERRGQTGPNGRALCTWCGQEVPKGRRTWCSQQCVNQYREQADWGFLRRKVQNRDHGICAICGTDTAALYRRYVRFKIWIQSRYRLYFKQLEITRKWLAKQYIPAGREISDWWDADHIVPCVEGGRDSLDNLRTLCIRCHRLETKALRARLRKAKRGELPLEF